MSKPVVLVTGASRGIGLAVATQLLESFDARVVTVSRSLPEALQALSAKYPEHLATVQGDITDEIVSQRAVAAAESKFGSLDGIVLNAGAFHGGAVAKEELTVDQWKILFDINFFSLLHTVRHSLPLLRASKGSIIAISSGASAKGTPGWGPYGATKAAVNSLIRTLAAEEKEVASIALRPGVVATDMVSSLQGEAGAKFLSKDDHEKFKGVKPIEASQPAYVIAGLAVEPALDLSGSYLSWDEDKLKGYRKQ